MKLLHCADRGAFIAALETLGRGDCIETDRFSDIASSAAELLTAAEQISARGADFTSGFPRWWRPTTRPRSRRRCAPVRGS